MLVIRIGIGDSLGDGLDGAVKIRREPEPINDGLFVTKVRVQVDDAGPLQVEEGLFLGRPDYAFFREVS